MKLSLRSMNQYLVVILPKLKKLLAFGNQQVEILTIDAYEILTFTINADGTADLNCDASSSLADHIPFTYVSTDGTDYVFVDEDGYELTFTYDGTNGYLTYEGDYLYLYGSSAYEKIA